MKKLALSLLSIAAILVGCTSQYFDDPNVVVGSQDLSNQQFKFRSSQEALKIALKAIGDISPAGDVALSRGMADITLYEGKYEISEPTPGAIYVVNFSSGGYALVPADADGDEVVGVSDVGSFYVVDDDPNDIGSYILTLASNFSALPKDSITTLVPGDSINYEENAEMYNGRLCYVRYNRVVEQAGPLLATNWHQHEPYSHMCPTYDTTDQYGNDTTPHYAVGCVPLAMSQIMTYHRHPASHVDRAGISYTYDWDLITEKGSYGEYEFTPASLEVAKLTWSVAKDIIFSGVQDENGNGGGWGIDYSLANPYNAAKLFREFDYNVPNAGNATGSLQTYDFDIIKDQIDKQLPVYTRGSLITARDGHAWVIDGYFHNYAETIYVDVETGEVVDVVRTKNDEKVHCNMGSVHIAPGYFTSGIFDTVEGNYSDNVKMIIDIEPNK